MDIPPGVLARAVTTERLRVHTWESGSPGAPPLVLLHGNLSTGAFYLEHLAALGEHFHVLAPDMRGFGRTEALPIDATRGLGDWADDLHALLVALEVTAPPHLLGWSTGGAAVTGYAMAHPVASLTLVAPVSPHGYGGVRPDGTLCAPDGAGSGGGTANPEVVARIAAGDAGTDSPFAIRNVIRAFYVAPGFTLDPALEDLLVDEVLRTRTGDGGYPGSALTSEHWPFTAPGTTGLLNALSPRYCSWARLVDLEPKPPVLWMRGDADAVVADGSMLEMGTLGAAGVVPGWPGADVFPPQPMVAQTAEVLDAYAAAGGTVRTEVIAGSGHGPMLDAPERWRAVLTDFLTSAGRPGGPST